MSTEVIRWLVSAMNLSSGAQEYNSMLAQTLKNASQAVFSGVYTLANLGRRILYKTSLSSTSRYSHSIYITSRIDT